MSDQAYIRNYVREYRNKRRTYAYAKLGGRCVKCGSTDSLEFDHIDPTTKILTISKLWTASKTIFEEELAKCQLLCHKCHLEKTIANGDNYIPAPASHGSLTLYNRGCRCNECKIKYKNWKREYRKRKPTFITKNPKKIAILICGYCDKIFERDYNQVSIPLKCGQRQFYCSIRCSNLKRNLGG